MNAWLQANLSEVALLCLDHDLGPTRLRDGVRFDPGVGRDVVDALVAHRPACPVIVHTSNYHAAPGMILALETHGWDVARVTPFDDLEWLTRVWAGVVEEKLG